MIEFEIPHVPPSANDKSGAHWTDRARSRKEWRPMAKLYAIAAGVKLEATSPATVTLCFRLPHGGDADNRCKSVLDSLVDAGLLVSDGPPHLYELRLRSERGKPARTLVRIEPARP